MSKTQKVDAAVLSYMKQQNRPYSALDIFNNLHKAHGKTAIVKSLETLASEKKLLEKTYGKSKIYVYHQSQFPDVSDEQLGKLDEKLKSVQCEIDTTTSKINTASKTLSNILTEPATADALASLKELQESHTITVAAIKKMSKPDQKKLDPQQKQKMVKVRDDISSQMKKRKRYTTDLMNAVLEGYPKSKKQFVEEVGLELD